MLNDLIREKYLTVLKNLDDCPEEFTDLRPDFWGKTTIYIRLIFLGLYSYVKELEKKIEELTSEITSLKNLLNLNSSNSSLPPSSDRKREKYQRPSSKRSKRKPGGQTGHKGYTKVLLDTSKVDEIKDYYPSTCTCCGKSLPHYSANQDYIRHQVSEIEFINTKTIEYRFHKVDCINCQTKNVAVRPDEVRESSFGPNVEAAVSLLTGTYGLSKRQTQSYFKDFHNLEISPASIIALEDKMSNRLKDPVEKITESIRNSNVLNIDETGWTVNNKPSYLWTFVSDKSILYQITSKRNQVILKELLGENYCGIVGSDRCGIYNLFSPSKRGLCWAHLKRDFQRFSEMEGGKGEFGSHLLEISHNVFELWHKFKDKEFRRNDLQFRLIPIKVKMQDILEKATENKDKILSRFAKKLIRLWPALWNFSEIDKLEPTNNSAERALRRPVIFRKLSFGNKSEEGAIFLQRIYSITATCKKQKRNVLEYLSNLAAEQYNEAILPVPT